MLPTKTKPQQFWELFNISGFLDVAYKNSAANNFENFLHIPKSRLQKLVRNNFENFLIEHILIYKNSSHQSARHVWQSAACLLLAPAVSFIQSTNSSLSFFRRRNWPRTTYASVYPLDLSRCPNTWPTPARSVTGLSAIGSATKLRCFWLVVDMIFSINWNSTSTGIPNEQVSNYGLFRLEIIAP